MQDLALNEPLTEGLLCRIRQFYLIFLQLGVDDENF